MFISLNCSWSELYHKKVYCSTPSFNKDFYCFSVITFLSILSKLSVESSSVSTSDEELINVRVMRIIGYKLTPFQRLHILLTKDDDAAFFFFLDISESDFRTLRQRQGLLVDMSSFPSMLEGLLNSCRLLSHVFLINNLMKANCYHLGSRKSALCSLKNSLNIQIDIRSPSLFKLSLLEQNYLVFFWNNV